MKCKFLLFPPKSKDFFLVLLNNNWLVISSFERVLTCVGIWWIPPSGCRNVGQSAACQSSSTLWNNHHSWVIMQQHKGNSMCFLGALHRKVMPFFKVLCAYCTGFEMCSPRAHRAQIYAPAFPLLFKQWGGPPPYFFVKIAASLINYE